MWASSSVSPEFRHHMPYLLNDNAGEQCANTAGPNNMAMAGALVTNSRRFPDPPISLKSGRNFLKF